MVPIDLSDKAILLTGAMGAVAEYMVRRLTEAGTFLLLTDAKQNLQDWRIPESSHLYLPADIIHADEVEVLVSSAFEKFPRIDIALGHAGGCRLHPFGDASEAEFEPIFRFNFFGQTHLARSVLARWIDRKIAGHLIFTSSYVARVPHTLIPAYSSAEATLENFARSLALESALSGIRINVVSPGNVAAGSSLKVFEADPAYREFVLRVSLGKRNSPKSIADAFVSLCSPLANEANGQILSPDYGARIGSRL